MPRRDRLTLGWILLGALLLRLVVMWMPGDPMFENGNLPYEELLRGNATYDLMHGRLLPLLDYQVNHFTGGSLAVSILAMPFFWALGPTFNVLRLVSLLFSVPLVLVIFLVAYRWHGRRAAIVASLLVAFGPPGFVFLSCTVYGTHPETNLLAVGLVWLAFGWRDAGRGGMLRTFLFGTAIGFALWFSYGLTVIVGILLLCEFATIGMRRARATDLPLGIGFVLGFSPWIAYMATHPGRAFHIYGESISEHFQAGLSHGGALAKVGRLIAKDGPDAFWMHGAWEQGGLQIARLFLYAFVGAILWCAWTGRGEIAAFGRALVGRRDGFKPTLRLVALLFVCAWFVAFAVTDFEVDWFSWVQGYRYLIPFWPFMAILLGIAVQDLASRGRARVPAAAVAVVCCTFLGFTLAQVRPERWSTQWAAPATKPLWNLRMLVLRFGNDAETMQYVLRRAIEVRTPDEQQALVSGLAAGIARFATVKGQDEWEEARRREYAATLTDLRTSGPELFRPVFERARIAALEKYGTR